MEPRGRSGFSLVELMVALVCTGLLLAGMARVFQASLASWSQVNASLAAQRGLRWALEALALDLRMLGCLTPAPELRPPEVAASADPGRQSAFMLVPGPVLDELSFVLDSQEAGAETGPLRVVRYAVVDLLEERSEPVPCLVRFETAYPADQAVPRWLSGRGRPRGSWRVLAEHVTGFRVELALGAGPGIRGADYPGTMALLNAALEARSGLPEEATRPEEPFWFRKYPLLVSVALELGNPGAGPRRYRATLRVAPRNTGLGGAG